MIRALACALVLAGCTSGTELSIEVLRPTDQRGFQSIAQLNFNATRDGVVLAQSTFGPSAAAYTLNGLTHGRRTVLTLDGVDANGVVIARGRTCPLDFEGSGTTAPLYFSPTNFFAPTAKSPLTVRQKATADELADGTVLIAGGSDASGKVLSSTELFTPGRATFTAGKTSLAQARTRAQSVYLSSVGDLIVGGLDASGNALAGAELYYESQQQWLAVSGLDARVDHRVVVLSDGRALVSGGSASDGGAPLATTWLVYVTSDGTYQVTAGPPLAEARRDHAAVTAGPGAIVFGGYGSDGAPLDSIELLDPASTSAAAPIAHLLHARAGATASLLPGGSILIAGGIGSDGTPRADAELFEPYSRATTLYSLAAARRDHTATVLSDGRVLVAGGFDAASNALASVELFASDLGFLTERSLDTARGGHAAVPLCDGTVLIVGATAGAELYTEPAN